MNPRNLNMRLGLAAALMCGFSEATQDTPEADKEADEKLAREMEARRQREQEQKAEAERLMRWHAYETLHIPKMPTYQPEPRRRSKRAQRVKERGWR